MSSLINTRTGRRNRERENETAEQKKKKKQQSKMLFDSKRFSSSRPGSQVGAYCRNISTEIFMIHFTHEKYCFASVYDSTRFCSFALMCAFIS